MKQATCHLERAHKAKGLCQACYWSAWCAANKERRARTNQAWYAAHPGYSRAYQAAHPDSQRGYSRAWYAANKERVAIWHQAYRLANRERRAATRRAEYAANPERQLGYIRQRRARKLGAIGSITSDQWVGIKAAYAWRCAYCGKMPASLTQDHVIPLSLGGSHTPANIVPACRACNSSKGARPPTRLPAKRLLI